MSRLIFTEPSPKFRASTLPRSATRHSVWTLFDQEIRTSGDAGGLTLSQFYRLVSSGTFHPVDPNRHWVAVSLAEAETLRRVLHMRGNLPLMPESKDASKDNTSSDESLAEVALRFSPLSSPGAEDEGDGGILLDISSGCQGASLWRARVAGRHEPEPGICRSQLLLLAATHTL